MDELKFGAEVIRDGGKNRKFKSFCSVPNYLRPEFQSVILNAVFVPN